MITDATRILFRIEGGGRIKAKFEIILQSAAHFL